jgi:hypothetical protein
MDIDIKIPPSVPYLSIDSPSCKGAWRQTPDIGCPEK